MTVIIVLLLTFFIASGYGVCLLGSFNYACLDTQGYSMCQRAENITNNLVSSINEKGNTSESFIFLQCENVTPCHSVQNNRNRNLTTNEFYYRYFCSSLQAYTKCMEAKNYYEKLFDKYDDLPNYLKDITPIDCDDYAEFSQNIGSSSTLTYNFLFVGMIMMFL